MCSWIDGTSCICPGGYWQCTLSHWPPHHLLVCRGMSPACRPWQRWAGRALLLASSPLRRATARQRSAPPATAAPATAAPRTRRAAIGCTARFSRGLPPSGLLVPTWACWPGAHASHLLLPCIAPPRRALEPGPAAYSSHIRSCDLGVCALSGVHMTFRRSWSWQPCQVPTERPGCSPATASLRTHFDQADVGGFVTVGQRACIHARLTGVTAAEKQCTPLLHSSSHRSCDLHPPHHCLHLWNPHKTH